MSNADLSAAQDKSLQAFRDELDLLDKVRACDLWSADYDFSHVCSCDECRPKIETLNAFEKEIKAKRKLISNHLVQVDKKDDLCISIAGSANWTKRTVDLFQKKLKAVYKKLGIPWTIIKSSSADKLEATDKAIDEMLNSINKPYHRDASATKPDPDAGADGACTDDDSKLDHNAVADVACTDDSKLDPNADASNIDDDDDDDLSDEIEIGLFHYEKTKANDKAYVLLQEIGKLEKDHYMEKMSSEAQNKSLDPAISMKYIEKQIELLKALPVEELRHEVEEVIAEIRPVNVHSKMFEKARESMYHTCFAMIRKRKEFWRGSPSLGIVGNEHNSNGLKETLDSLINEVNLFENQWKEVYAPFFTPHDRSGPKKQD